MDENILKAIHEHKHLLDTYLTQLSAKRLTIFNILSYIRFLKDMFVAYLDISSTNNLDNVLIKEQFKQMSENQIKINSRLNELETRIKRIEGE